MIELAPIGSARTQQDYIGFAKSAEPALAAQADDAILSAHSSDETWSLPGFSLAAAAEVEFAVDMAFGGRRLDGRNVPNLRERLVCPITGLNNRQRIVASLLKQLADPRNSAIYLMEQITPIYRWVSANFNIVVGSEYLGDLPGGTVYDGIRHEDIERLQFPTATFDFLVSNDVLEHVPDPRAALRECARVLKQGGRMIATFPFNPDRRATEPRAEKFPDRIGYLKPPEYHGNPIAPESGSLVWTDFGWDFLDFARRSGFRDAYINYYHSTQFGHLGPNPVFFFER